MLLSNEESNFFNADEVKRGTLIWAKHKSWAEGIAGMVTEASGELLKVQYLPSIENITNHYFIWAAEVYTGDWEIKYSNDGLNTVCRYPDEKEDDKNGIG